MVGLAMGWSLAGGAWAGEIAMCPSFAQAAYATAKVKDTGLSKIDAKVMADRSISNANARLVIEAIIDSVYDADMEPQGAYEAVLMVCVEDGGW